MAADDLARFRRMCRQFRWLAVFMVCSVGAILALMYVIVPAVFAARGEHRDLTLLLREIVWASPTLLYLFAVWSIGSALGQLAKGRLIQPTLSSALRRVGLALGFGGLLSVFGVTNLMRLLGDERSSWAYFDVAGMTLGMIGGALFLLGRVIDQAGLLQAEMDEMI
ncbi:hypothetical protein ER13_14385 [Brevundimonas sp. EAKA]|jgi:hypothetical protein|uniref:DUF2975 domain-containing protein n=2 Tax=Brevundimonas TaxID=41275 RepID=A0A7Z9C8F1_9CAUL|nr:MULTISPECIES: hypothetical protein [Brevundimonas]MBU4196948.1 DUF2975 domain-containing protein [Alphaproteobacteria bacterium]OGN43247.1 MAG: DUF2975 domain-containing protein [Caulobacterales bacterium GWE1_67_11]KDP94088.1 hypothetical protein ER13_14385 [Brevundimonas sp. EAKA]MCG2664119.1 DUF2975 domain-containing protein [Brevundimonas sp.]PZO03007.1 MAG: DUF2975 domain-containing protein [Alphaproteobacteria bacterium]